MINIMYQYVTLDNILKPCKNMMNITLNLCTVLWTLAGGN